MNLLPAPLGRDDFFVQNPTSIAPGADHSAIHRSDSFAQRTLRDFAIGHGGTIARFSQLFLSRSAHIVRHDETPVLNAFPSAALRSDVDDDRLLYLLRASLAFLQSSGHGAIVSSNPQPCCAVLHSFFRLVLVHLRTDAGRMPRYNAE